MLAYLITTNVTQTEFLKDVVVDDGFEILTTPKVEKAKAFFDFDSTTDTIHKIRKHTNRKNLSIAAYDFQEKTLVLF